MPLFEKRLAQNEIPENQFEIKVIPIEGYSIEQIAFCDAGYICVFRHPNNTKVSVYIKPEKPLLQHEKGAIMNPSGKMRILEQYVKKTQTPSNQFSQNIANNRNSR